MSTPSESVTYDKAVFAPERPVPIGIVERCRYEVNRFEAVTGARPKYLFLGISEYEQLRDYVAHAPWIVRDAGVGSVEKLLDVEIVPQLSKVFELAAA